MNEKITVNPSNLLSVPQKIANVQPKVSLIQKPDVFEKTTNNNEKTITPVSKNTKKVIGIAVASALGASAITFLIMKGRQYKVDRDLEHARILNAEAKELKASAKTLIDEAEQRVEGAVESATKILKEEVNSYKTKLDNILKTDTSNPNATFSEKLIQQAREEVSSFTLEYNPTKPPIKEVVEAENLHRGIQLPEVHIPTQNRANMIELNIPKFIEGKKFEFEVPMTDSAKITKVTAKPFKSIQNFETTIAADYADSVMWDKNKIARDILQNFFDGHGQTLDGVKLAFEPIGKGRYKVKIEGKSTFDVDKAILLGNSSKKDNANAAGNFGEGLKVTVLKLLKESGTKDVKIASNDWKLTYNFKDSSNYGKEVLSFSVDKTAKLDGNYMEFETADKELLSSLRKSINRFYHSGNTDFKCPDFENKVFGIKKLGKGEKGSVYIAGQKFEFDHNWEGLDGFTIFFKEKTPAKFKYGFRGSEQAVFDASRDRVSMNKDDLERIAKYFGSSEKTSKEELANAINLLKPYWDEDGFDHSHGYKLLNGLTSAAYEKSMQIDFPKEYIGALYSIDKLMEQTLKGNGYKICKDIYFQYIGMKDITNLVNISRNHIAIAPSEKEIKKIAIIKKALAKFAPYLRKEKYFSPDELNPKIYLFNRKASAESALNKGTLAEAMTADRYTEGIGGFKDSKGFWLDRDYLDKSSFSEVVGTALHEITHKVGGDESSEFSYKLTDVLKETLESRMSDNLATEELKALRKIWDELQ